MKITFLLPNINQRGGTRVVLEYSNLLAGLGADVTVVFPTRLRRLPFLANEIEYLWRAPFKLITSKWFHTRAKVRPVPGLESRYIPDADVMVATAWQTAAFAATYPRSKGEPYYFIQDIETHTDPDRAGATYSLPFKRIVISPWVRNQLREHFGASIHALIPNGLDFDLYRPAPAGSLKTSSEVVVGALYDKARKKGFDLVLQVVERVRADHPSIRLFVFGTPRRAPEVPPFVVPHWKLLPAQTATFYHGCHIWLCASRSEGMHLPPMEAMASGCAVVTTSVGGTSYYAIPQKTALVCAPGDAEGLYRSVQRLVGDASLRQRLSSDGAEYIRRLDVRDSARNMLKALSGEQTVIEPDTGCAESSCQ